MAKITDKKTIFFVTSPRTPIKMRDEIKFLAENFSGKIWNDQTQKEFYTALSGKEFFEGTVGGDIALKARDRITRAPKSLGFISLKPTISLSDAGKEYIYGKRPEEIFTRQLLKFQLPSPYHIDKEGKFGVKPYLELMRLVYELNGLNKNEIALFVVQLIHVNKYELIKEKIVNLRNEAKERKNNQVSYKTFIAKKFEEELSFLFAEELKENKIKTRESKEQSKEKFIETKKRNHIDYADAAIRYLRGTALFSFNPKSSKVVIIEEKKADLEYLLNNIKREVEFYPSEEKYGAYLFDAKTPTLLSDNKNALTEKIIKIDSSISDKVLKTYTIEKLKDKYQEIATQKLDTLVENQVRTLQTYQEYEDIIEVFSQIETRKVIEPSLFLEWNTWRALTMLDDGMIEGNFKIDDAGMPLYTAPANMADIVCKYNNFEMTVEVTMSSGQKQYEMEGEPVARHLGQHKKTTSRDVYCIFIAPQVNKATLAYYYSLYRSNIQYYGGQAKIIPLSLEDFKVILKNSYEAKQKPNSISIKRFLDRIAELASNATNEIEWEQEIKNCVRSTFSE